MVKNTVFCLPRAKRRGYSFDRISLSVFVHVRNT